jgi:hypothetical protein
MRYPTAILVSAGMLALTGGATATPHEPTAAPATQGASTSSYFLAPDPHVPLAIVVDGHLSAAPRGHDCGDAHRWARIGSKWNALDEWGQIAGTFVVSAGTYRDATGCTEVDLSPASPDTRRHVLVSADSAWTAPTSAERAVGSGYVRAFDALVAKTIPDGVASARDVPARCTSISQHRRFFEVPGQGQFAVGTSNGGYVVARLGADDRWSVVASERSGWNGSSAVCYRPVAVFDMDGDGRPEIILRRAKGTSWSDVVYGLGDGGRLRAIATN